MENNRYFKDLLIINRKIQDINEQIMNLEFKKIKLVGEFSKLHNYRDLTHNQKIKYT